MLVRWVKACTSPAVSLAHALTLHVPDACTQDLARKRAAETKARLEAEAKARLDAEEAARLQAQAEREAKELAEMKEAKLKAKVRGPPPRAPTLVARVGWPRPLARLTRRLCGCHRSSSG